MSQATNTENQTSQAASAKPDFIAYTVTDIAGKEDAIWTRLGAAFLHKDGNGMNVELNALPVNGRITLRAPNDEASSTP